jgi:hypothetical protein
VKKAQQNNNELYLVMRPFLLNETKQGKKDNIFLKIGYRKVTLSSLKNSTRVQKEIIYMNNAMLTTVPSSLSNYI